MNPLPKLNRKCEQFASVCAYSQRSHGGQILFSDGQNIYNRVVLVCKVNVYIPASLDRRSILRYLEIVLTLLTVRGLILTYVVGNIVNNLKILLPDIFLFFASYFKYRKQKTQPYLQYEI